MSVGVNSLIVTCYGPLTGTVVVYHDVWYNYDTKTENGDRGGESERVLTVIWNIEADRTISLSTIEVQV